MKRNPGLTRWMALWLVTGVPVYPALADDFSSWARHMRVTFSGYNRPESLTNFPALVTLGSPMQGFRYSAFLSGSNTDLRFTDATQTNPLNYEIDWWDTNATSYVWVQVPLLTNNAVIWAFWGKTNQTTPACTTNGSVWSESYRGVWHMNSVSPRVPNSVSNGIAGTPSGTVSVVAGDIGNALSFGGTTADYVDATGTDVTDPDTLTVTAWIRNPALSSGAGMIFTHRSSANEIIQLGLQDNTHPMLQLRSSANILYPLISPTSYTASDWTHVAGIFNNAGPSYKHILLINGKEELSTNKNFGTETFSASRQTIGATYGGALYGNPFKGPIDELRVSSVARSTNWIWAEYMTMASNRAFCTTDWTNIWPLIRAVPILEYRFNESGTSAPSTALTTTPVMFRNSSDVAADLHSADGAGVSGKAGDRAFDNSAATGMGQAGSGGVARHDVDLDAIDQLASFTITLWYKTDRAVFGNYARLLSNHTNVSGFAVGNTENVTGDITLTVDGQKAFASGFMDSNSWVFLALTYDGSTSKTYRATATSEVALVVSQSQAKGVVDTEGQRLYVGNLIDNASVNFQRPFDGFIDNLRIYGSKTDNSGVLGSDELNFIRQQDLADRPVFAPNGSIFTMR